MPVSVGTVMLLLCLFQIKHMFADFFLQTPKMLAGRGQYWHMGRAQHAGVHVIASILVFLIMGAPIGFILIIVALEWVIHFNIDYGKASYSAKKELAPTMARFWHAVGFDQCLHQLTYIAMTWAWIEFAV